MNSKKIKISLIIPNLSVGGSEKVIATIANSLDKEKFEVHLIVLDHSVQGFTFNKDVKVYDLKVKRVLFSFPKIRKVLKSISPDIAFSTLGYLNLYLLFWKKFFPKKTKFVVRESIVLSKVMADKENVRFPILYTILYNTLYQKPDAIVCQSNDMFNDFLAHYKIPKEKFVVINNPIFEEQMDHQTKKLDSNYDCVSIGRLSYQKGFDRLIEISSKIKDKMSFAILGEGNERGHLESEIQKHNVQEKVTLLGFQKDPGKYINQAKLYLMTSHYEGFPNVLIEAGAHGIPCIAFNVPGGINEIIEDGINGFLVEDGNIEAYSKAIEKALNHNFDSEKIKALTMKKYGMKKIMGEYESLFSKLVNQ